MGIRFRVNKLLDFLDSPLGSQLKYYSLFYLILWSMHLILISLISYFHFLLNHNIRTIGDWIGDRGWELIILSKILIFYFALQFIRLKLNKVKFINSYFQNSFQLPRKEIVASLLFLLIALMGLGGVKVNQSFIAEFGRVILSIVGTFVFFSVDYALLIVLEIFFPIQNQGQRSQKLLIFPFLFYCFTYSTFIYEQTVNFNLYAFFFLLMYVGEWKRRNWNIPLIFLVLFLIPVYSFFGFDPVWSDNYSIFTMERAVDSFSFFILIAFVIGYLHLSNIRNPEYIYRE